MAVGAGSSRAGIVNRSDGAAGGAVVGEVAAKDGRARYGEHVRLALAEAEALIADEEESLILDHRAAEIRSELVLGEGRARHAILVVEERVAVEDFVAQKLVGASMVGVGSGFRGQIDDTARETAVLRVVVVGLDAKLLHRVLRRYQGGQVGVTHVDRRAIQERGTLVGRPSANLEVAGRKDVLAGEVSHGSALRHNAGHQGDQVQYVASVERHLLHHSAFDHLTEGGVFRL